MYTSLCFIITLLVKASHQRAAVLATSNTGNSDTVGPQIFVDHVDRWKNISSTNDLTVSPEFTTDDPTDSCPPCRCGVSRNSSFGIVGGNVTSVQKYPWMAYIVSEKGGEPFLCGGSIINNKYVMTAAHCVVEANGHRVEPKKLTVELLRYFWFEYTKFNVTKIKVHEEYKSVGNGSDIALLRLDSDLNIGPKSEYRSVCLPHAGENFVDYNGIITGWGYKRENGFPSYLLREVIVPVMSNKECSSFYSGRITNDMMCAGYEEGGKDACVGDSGGPLHIKKNSTYYEVGIVSWGHGCARPRFPGVYTRVNKYLDWLAVNTKDACSCSES